MKELELNIIKHYDSFVKCRDIDSSVTYGSLDCKDYLANLKTSKNPHFIVLNTDDLIAESGNDEINLDSKNLHHSKALAENLDSSATPRNDENARHVERSETSKQNLDSKHNTLYLF